LSANLGYSLLSELRANAGRRREAEVAAGDDSFSTAVAVKLFCLSFLGPGIHGLRREQRAQFLLVLRYNACVLRIRGEVVRLVRVTFEIEQLRAILDVVDIFEAAGRIANAPVVEPMP